jgi:hypothetical protein
MYSSNSWSTTQDKDRYRTQDDLRDDSGHRDEHDTDSSRDEDRHKVNEGFSNDSRDSYDSSGSDSSGDSGGSDGGGGGGE